MNEVIKLINDRLDRIENKLDSAIRFKWTIMGVVMGVSSAFGIVITLLRFI